jgi:hypothetical protein
VNTSIRAAAVAVLIVLSAGCGASIPTAPTGPSQAAPSPAPTPPPATPLPPFSGPFRTFSFERELSYPVSDYTKNSQLPLYDNGALLLRYLGRGEYRGVHTEANGSLAFDWGGVWTATATLQGDLLTVEYSLRMQLDDFENGVYVRAQ